MTGRTVRASGTGSATTTPDAAVVRLAVTHRADDLAEALAGAESARAEVVTTARGHVAAPAVGSTGLSVWPDHDQSGRQNGYRARHGLHIACTDLRSAGEVVAALATTAAGRLEIESVTLEVSDPGPALDDARRRAVVEARRRAAQLAGLAGGRLGGVLHVVEHDGAAGAAPGVRALEVVAADVALEPGEATVRTTVTVEFELDGI